MASNDRYRQEEREANRQLYALIVQFNNESLYEPGNCIPLNSLSPNIVHFSFKSLREYTAKVMATESKGFYDSDSSIFNRFLKLKPYLGEKDDKNKNYLSVLFSIDQIHLYNLYHFKIVCAVCIRDIRDELRYPQSFGYTWDAASEYNEVKGDLIFGLENYISVDMLLDEQADLLPDGDLNVSVQIHEIEYGYKLYFGHFTCREVMECIKKEESEDGSVYSLHLDSKVAKGLGLVSSYFEKIADTDMIESSTRYMRIPEDEFVLFREVLNLFAGCPRINCFSIVYICDVYTVAEKYDIRFVVDTCRDLLESFYRNDNDDRIEQHAKEHAETIIEFAELYSDSRIKKIVCEFLERNHGKGEKKPFDEKNRTTFVATWECNFDMGPQKFAFWKFQAPEKEEDCGLDFYK